MPSPTRARSTRPRSTARCTTSSKARRCRPRSRTRTPSTGRSAGSPTAATRTTPPRTGSSPRRRPRARRTSRPRGDYEPPPGRPRRARSARDARASPRARELPLQVPVAVPALAGEAAVREGGLDRTPGLPFVAAVGEPALCGELDHVLECAFEPLVGEPQVELAHAGVVHHEPATGSATSSRRVVVCRPDPSSRVPRRQKVLAEELVDESGLAHAGRAHEGSVTPAGSSARTASRPSPVTGGHGVDGHRASISSAAATDSGSPSRSAFVSRITGRAPLSQARVVPLEHARVHVLGERCRDEDDVDVRRDRLLSRGLGPGVMSCAARELRSPGRTALMAGFPRSRVSIATQSPTTGAPPSNRPRGGGARRRGRAPRRPPSASHSPRCCTLTRPSSSPSARKVRRLRPSLRPSRA